MPGLYGDVGLANGYLGVGLDVYGNYSSPGFDGTGCPASPSWAAAQMPGQVVVRGPGNGTAGYCPVDSSARVYAGEADTGGVDQVRVGSAGRGRAQHHVDGPDHERLAVRLGQRARR